MGIQRQLMLVAILLFGMAASQAATSNRLFLTWDASPDYETNTAFQIFTSTNIVAPVSSWPLLTNIPFTDFTNAAKPGEFGRVEIQAAAFDFNYYVVTASNVTGISDFSEPVQIRRIRAGTRVRIGAY